MVFLDWDRIASVDDLTLLRSRRTPTVASGKRGATYAASLAQAEELWRAASNVSPLASPILRYYALMQVSLAVDAASPLPNQEWMPGESHGLTLDLDRPTNDGRLEFSVVRISPSGDGAVQTLARALRSPMIEPDTPLDAVLAALWNSRYLADELTPMRLYPRRPLPVDVTFGDGAAVAYFFGNLLRADPGLTELGAGRLQEFLAGYPGLRELDDYTIAWDRQSREQSLALGFGGETWQAKPSWWQAAVDVLSVKREPWQGTNVHGMLFPAIGTAMVTIHPLLTWYVALYAFSILARYYGDLWRRRLDVDADQDAVALIQLVDGGSVSAMDLAATVLRDFLEKARAERNG